VQKRSNRTAGRQTSLSESVRIRVRFSEVDSLRIVWHGHYLKYFEDGREAFGEKFGIGYLDIYKSGLLTPIVSVQCDYRKPARFGDLIEVETCFADTDAAKIIFHYTIRNLSDNNEVIATGETTQVFLDSNNELILTPPEFFMDWKKRWKLIL
jgi:acyl-CoA thioester hydrolase